MIRQYIPLDADIKKFEDDDSFLGFYFNCPYVDIDHKAIVLSILQVKAEIKDLCDILHDIYGVI